jgi:hypothetical protein
VGGYMEVDVQIIEGGQLIKTEKMKLKMVKEFSDDVIIYENEDGRAVVYFKQKDEYVLISIGMA